jgi:hypothetical protein
MVQSLGSNSSATSDSIRTGSSDSVQPKRRARRPKWVSTVMPGNAERIAQHHVRRFPSDAGQRHQVFQPAGHHAVVLVHNPVRQREEVPRLGAEKPVGLMMASSSAVSASAMARASG